MKKVEILLKDFLGREAANSFQELIYLTGYPLSRV